MVWQQLIRRSKVSGQYHRKRIPKGINRQANYYFKAFVNCASEYFNGSHCIVKLQKQINKYFFIG